MTKKELADQMMEFLAVQDHSVDNEWYCTKRERASDVLQEFAEWIAVKVNLEL